MLSLPGGSAVPGQLIDMNACHGCLGIWVHSFTERPFERQGVAVTFPVAIIKHLTIAT